MLLFIQFQLSNPIETAGKMLEVSKNFLILNFNHFVIKYDWSIHMAELKYWNKMLVSLNINYKNVYYSLMDSNGIFKFWLKLFYCSKYGGEDSSFGMTLNYKAKQRSWDWTFGNVGFSEVIYFRFYLEIYSILPRNRLSQSWLGMYFEFALQCTGGALSSPIYAIQCLTNLSFFIFFISYLCNKLELDLWVITSHSIILNWWIWIILY